jgi:G3E family GTPase
MNALAKIHRTQRAQIDVGRILDIKARDLDAPFELPVTDEQDENEHGEHGHAHEQDDGEEHEGHGPAKHIHYHDEKVRSFSIVEDRPLDLKRTEAWISELLSSMGADIYRCKGILFVQGQPKRVVFQGVQMMFDATPERFWKPDETRQSRMVFIGKELDEAKIRAGFESCLAT